MDVFLVEDKDQWERYISEEQITLLHSTCFLENFRDDDIEPIYLLFEDNGETKGCLAGLEIRSSNALVRSSGKFKTSFFYSGPKLIQGTDETSVFKALGDYLRRRGHAKYHMMEMDHPHPIPELGKGYEVFSQEEFYIDLAGDWDDVWKKIKRRIRRKVRFSVDAGIKYKISKDPKMVSVLKGLLGETARFRQERGYGDFNLAPIPHLKEVVMERMLETGCAITSLAFLDEEVLSLEYMVTGNSQAVAFFNGTTPRGYDVGSNAFVVMNSMKELQKMGVQTFNMGGTPKIGAEGLEYFKLGFGAQKLMSYGLKAELHEGTLMGKLLDSYRKTRKSS